MKAYIIFTFLFLNVFLIDLLFAQGEEPVVISPLIGDKLDRVERDYFGLFPHFDGFQEAEFYLNPDSSLKVAIRYQIDEEIRDTTIKEYRSLSNLEYHLKKVITEDSEKGSMVSILKSDGGIIGGELIAVSEKSLLVYNPEEKLRGKDVSGTYGFNNLDFTNINEIEVKDKTNISTFIFPVLGALIGGLSVAFLWLQHAGYSLASAGLFLGIVVGGFSGVLLSSVAPIEIESETLIESPFDENDIEGLRDNARHGE